MHATARFALFLSLVIAGCLPGCQAFSQLSTRPTPPRVSDCLEEPQGVYPSPPADPKPGEPITDRHLVEFRAWANQVLGVATTDRILWRAERKCLRRHQEDGQIR